MAVVSASAIHIINFYLLNVYVYLKPFSKTTAIVKDVRATLSSIIRNEAVCVSATMKYSYSNIKLARAKNYLDLFQLLSLPVSVFIEETKGSNPRDLCVVFDKTCPLITKKMNEFSTLVSALKPSKAFLNSKFTVDTVA